MLVRWGLNQSCFSQVCPWKCQLTKTGKLWEGSCNLGISFRCRGLSDRQLSVSLPGKLLMDVSFQGWNLGFLAAAPQSPSCSQWPHGSQNTRDKVGSTEILGAPILSRASFLGLQWQQSCPSNLRLSLIPGFEFPYPVGVEVVKRGKKITSEHTLEGFCPAGGFENFSFCFEMMIFLYLFQEFQLAFRSTVKSTTCIFMSYKIDYIVLH